MMIMITFLRLQSKACLHPNLLENESTFNPKRILFRNDGVRAADELLCVEGDCRLCLH